MLRTIEVHSRDQFSLHFRRDSNWMDSFRRDSNWMDSFRRDSNWMDSDKHTALYHRFVETY